MARSNFLQFFENPAKIKVFEFLIKNPATDFSISQIAKGSKIGRTTLFRMWNALIRSKVLIRTRVIGNAKMYKLNYTNPLVEKLGDISRIIEESAKRRIK